MITEADKKDNENEKIAEKMLQQLELTQMKTTLRQPNSADEINMRELWSAIWKGKWKVVAITVVFSFASIMYALSLPNIYKSEALLAPAAESGGGMSGFASQFGGLASLAGVNIGGGSIDKTALALQVMQSRIFISQFIERHDLLIPLMAAKDWDISNDELLYDTDVYDVLTKTWVRDVHFPLNSKPSIQEAYKEFSGIMSSAQDKKSLMITVSIKHYSPNVAKQWVEWLIDDINQEMKMRDLTEAKKSISYLTDQLAKTKIHKIQEVLYDIIEEQTKTIMFAEVREQYVLKTIDPALSSELNFQPNRGLIGALGVLFGLIFSIGFLLIRFFVKDKQPS